MVVGRDIVIFCGMHFHAEYWTSKQHIAGQLVRKNRVLFVERRPWFRDVRRWLFLALGGLKKEGKNLYTLPALYLIPGNYRWSPVNRVNQVLAGYFLRRAMRRLGYRRPLLWSFVHDVPLVLQGLDGVKIYHCVDNWQEFPRWKKWLARHLEEQTARGAHIVFASARILAERLKKINPETHYFPNAVDLDAFLSRAPGRVPNDLARIPGPKICYMGTLEIWFDTALLKKIARRRPEWSFILFGARGRNFHGQSLLSLPNVYYLGLKKKQDLQGYIAGSDVCIIPFKVNALTRSVSPLKLFEYFACGKPVVSTDLPEVARFAPLVRIAGTSKAFEKVLRESLEEKGKLPRRRMAMARANSWGRRIEEYSRIIKKIDTNDRN